jgi:PAS domain S-box-containing protein
MTTLSHESDAHLHEAARRLDAILNNTREAVFLMDHRQQCVYANAAAETLTGYRFEEMRGRPLHDVVHHKKPDGSHYPIEECPIDRAFPERAQMSGEELFVHKDGSFYPVAFTASPMLDDSGKPVGTVIEARNIADEKARDAALRESEARLNAVVKQASTGIAQTNLDGRFTDVNDRYCEIVGRSRSELLTMRMQDITHPDDLSANLPSFHRLATEGKAFEIEKRYVRPDGSSVWVRNSVYGLRGAQGSVESIVAVSMDLTERRETEEALRRSEGRLRFLAELDESLRAARDAPEAMLAAASVLATKLQASRCAYADVDTDEENDRFVIRADYTAPGVPSSAGTYSLDLFGPRAAADMHQGRTLVVRDVAGELEPGEGREMFQAIGVDAIVCCPLVKNGRLAAMMAVHQDRPRDWQADEVELVETVAERCWAHVERVGAEARLRESEEFSRRVLQSSADCIKVLSLDTRLEFMSEGGMCAMEVDDFGGVSGSFWSELWSDDQRFKVQAAVEEALAGRTGRFQGFARTLKGTPRWWDVVVTPISGADGSPQKLLVVSRDITPQREAEEQLRELNETLESRVAERTAELEAAYEQLRQSQKMEAMGQLTGGVAHDFNNLLTPIVGTLDMLQRKGVGGEREQRLIGGAVQSAERAKTLVQRLLAFARRQPLQTSAVDIGALTRGMADLVSSTTGPQIRVVVDAPEDLPAAVADANQMEMAILNLAVNARDAMPDGGTLRLSVSAEQVDPGHPRLKPGRYVRVSVADTGIGMDEATLQRAIEPFFSTKGIGKGTGLGLSMVHGLASQLGGSLLIHSQPGVGTNVEVWLPASASAPADTASVDPIVAVTRGKGTALLVDDEELVRASTADMLIELGHEVIEADSAEAALRMIGCGLKPDLLVTDHLMPGMTGTELARRLQSEQPQLAVLIVSGYADAEGIAPDLPRLTKPFGSADLAAAVAGATERQG